MWFSVGFQSPADELMQILNGQKRLESNFDEVSLPVWNDLLVKVLYSMHATTRGQCPVQI